VLRKTLNLLPKLLKRASSAVLTLYLDSLRGLMGMREHHVLYLQGKYSVKPYYEYHFFFDPVKLCKRSYLSQLEVVLNRFFKSSF